MRPFGQTKISLQSYLPAGIVTMASGSIKGFTHPVKVYKLMDLKSFT